MSMAEDFDHKYPRDVPWFDDLKNGIWPRSFALWMAVFYGALFIIRPWEKLFPELGPLHFERWIAILTVVVVVLSGRFRPTLDLQTLAVLLFTCSLFLSGLFVGGLSFPYVYLTLVVFYFVLISVIRTPYELLFMVACYIVTMGVYLGKSQWEFFVHGAGRHEMGVLRLQGIDFTFGNDNALAASVVYSLPMLYCLYCVRNELIATWPGFYRKWFLRGLGAYAVLAVTSVMLTNSRTGAIGLVFFLILLAMRRSTLLGKFASLAMIGIVCIGIYFVLPADTQGRLQTIWTSADESDDRFARSARASTQGRWDGLRAGMAMFENHPVFGVGFDHFIPYRLAHVDGVELAAHNLIGELLGEAGILGAAAFALLVLATVINYRKAQRLAECAPGQPVPWAMGQLALACRDVVILLFLFGMSGHNLDRFNWLWAGAFCALAVQFSMAALDGGFIDQTRVPTVRNRPI